MMYTFLWVLVGQAETLALPKLPAGNTSVLVGRLVVTGDLNLEHWEAEPTFRDALRKSLQFGCTQGGSVLPYEASTAMCNVCFDSAQPSADGGFWMRFVARVRGLSATTLASWIATPTLGEQPLVEIDLNQRIHKRADEFETVTVPQLIMLHVRISGSAALMSADASADDATAVVPGYRLHGYVSDGGDDDTTERRLAAMCQLESDLTDGSRDQSLRLLHAALWYSLGSGVAVLGLALMNRFARAAATTVVAPRHISAWDTLWKRGGDVSASP
jgi:hypothetical protein